MRVLEVEQAQIILAALADDDPPRPLGRVGDDPRAFRIELPLQRLGEGRHPHRAAGPLRPQRRRREIGQRLADPGPRFGEQHVGRARRLGRGANIRATAAAIAFCPSRGSAPGPVSSASRSRASPSRIDNRARRRPLGRFLPLRQPREQHPLALLGPLQPRRDQPRPAPAEPLQRRIRRPRPLALGPVGIAQAVAAARSAIAPQRLRRLRLARRRLQPQRAAQPRRASAPRTAPDGRRRTARAGRAR